MSARDEMRDRRAPTAVLVGRLRAVAGALGFLTRLPVGRDDESWTAFTEHPAAAVGAGYVVGVLLAGALALAIDAGGTQVTATVALGFVLALYALVGINNLDGVADCGDAAVVHGDSARRRDVLRDSTTGVGALVAVVLVVLGVALAGLALVSLPVLAAVAIVVAAEVGARTGLPVLAAFATAPHEGLGSSIIEGTGSWSAIAAGLLALPALAWPAIVATPGLPTGLVSASTPPVGSGFAAVAGALAAVGGALAATGLVGWWAHAQLGGANGDVFGAASEIARVVALHVGVIAWTLS